MKNSHGRKGLGGALEKAPKGMKNLKGERSSGKKSTSGVTKINPDGGYGGKVSHPKPKSFV